ncbi:hypothetical protein COU18_01320 [Candidatus Kaiserbacteria bacterium CG10_big_fil_rev_8_21_14_0_10_51_14]|uniref:Isopentenyl phosphate kinase n=1 Tax=Candidatus Kaiserbacteria bacterium CG10_big_fil_rev_8_21_14_0_10_51_14 TaxID=1974610 RepID=A0A2H0UCF7_9BACT|nr:MAG: hypothetical protein COU18_01320 [Candidatus Kaiserbacteria bacterium CG10_big_fil_rev_8_21_14_0_10_51_14]
MMRNIRIIKLGGSIITDKKAGRPILRTRRIQEIAREIAIALAKKPSRRIILLYGAGSFGHPLAHRYGLLSKSLSKHTFVGVGYTVAAMRELGTHLAKLFLDAGIPVVPLQTSSFAYVQRGRLYFTDLAIVEDILKNGGVPLLGGDVVFSDHKRTTIASADTLAVELADRLKNVRLLFASDTDGVYATFPPRKHEKPLQKLDRVSLNRLLKTMRSKTTRTDVTGAMGGKLRALLAAHNTTAVVFNGNTRGNLSAVLSGKKRGTEVRL